MVCVRPGVLLVRASARRPVRALMALDFPTLERPANATSGGPGGGSSAMRPTARRNTACANALMAKAGNSNKIAPFQYGESGDEARRDTRGRDAGGGPRMGPGQAAGGCRPGVRRVPCGRRQQYRRGEPETRRAVLRIHRETA